MCHVSHVFMCRWRMADYLGHPQDYTRVYESTHCSQSKRRDQAHKRSLLKPVVVVLAGRCVTLELSPDAPGLLPGKER